MTFEEVKAKLVGKSGPPEVWEVERGSAKRYAVAVEDLNPFYLDDEFAAGSPYGKTLAPPGFFGWPVKQPSPRFPKIMEDLIDDLREAGFPDILDGSADFEFCIPVKAGDILVCTRALTNMSSRGGSSGRQMAFSTIESTYINQNGDTVAKVQQTLIALSSAT